MESAVLKHVPPALLVLSVALSATFVSAQQPPEALAAISLRGKVEAVDTTARTVTIRGDRGNVVTLDMPMSGTPDLQVGDTVTVGYYDRVSVRLKPAGEAAVDETKPPVGTAAAAAPGTLPGATVASQRTTTVTITGWDPSLRVVTFTGPKGTVYTRRLLDSTDASIMAGLKVGDRVDVTRTEALRFQVESRQTVSVAGTSAFRNRFSISALWGWDNQFTGDMIHEATGQTTGGVPINITDTSYDDVYGRMGLFKVGFNYRTTPRSEAAFNFVWGDSSADRVSIGTASSLNIPLTVDFEDMTYWGMEGGQRFFFARTRFTPFMGYLVGINRYGDIRGTFANVPVSATPGLAAQDGKFFEKSWAMSLGPTGGFLVGAGPIEFMFEVQLRYMGGLSDVDWLVEEGLRDINEESSRWSYPIQLGARVRF
jgi:hypothetical protein